MKIYVNDLHQIKATHIASDDTLREVETNAFDGWPLAKVLCYCYDDSNGTAIGVYPYVSWPQAEASVGMGAEQETMLAQLGVPADENMAGHAAAVRDGMDVALRDLPDEAAYDVKVLAREWTATKADGSPAEYVANDKRTFEGAGFSPDGENAVLGTATAGPKGRFYRCLTGHRVDDPAWTPEDAPGLWVEIPDPGEEWPLIPNPIPAEASWVAGMKGRTADGRRWVCLVDNNTWQPEEYPTGWEAQA